MTCVHLYAGHLYFLVLLVDTAGVWNGLRVGPYGSGCVWGFLFAPGEFV